MARKRYSLNPSTTYDEWHKYGLAKIGPGKYVQCLEPCCTIRKGR